MNDLQSLLNTMITDKSFSKTLGYKMHLPEDNKCFDNPVPGALDTSWRTCKCLTTACGRPRGSQGADSRGWHIVVILLQLKHVAAGAPDGGSLHLTVSAHHSAHARWTALRWARDDTSHEHSPSTSRHIEAEPRPTEAGTSGRALESHCAQALVSRCRLRFYQCLHLKPILSLVPQTQSKRKPSSGDCWQSRLLPAAPCTAGAERPWGCSDPSVLTGADQEDTAFNPRTTVTVLSEHHLTSHPPTSLQGT